jgi:hypothetical protein
MSASPGTQKRSAYSVFEYLYRDASNYKSWGSVLLKGVATPLEIQGLIRSLEDASYFVAEQVRVPALCETLYALSGGQTEDDHAFHEYVALRAATQKEVAALPVWGSVEDLLRAFRAVQGAWHCGTRFLG